MSVLAATAALMLALMLGGVWVAASLGLDGGGDGNGTGTG